MYTIFGQLNRVKPQKVDPNITIARLHARTGVSYQVVFNAASGVASCVVYNY